VARVSAELAARGHRVLVIAPSESGSLVRDTRKAIRSAPEQLLESAAREPVVLGVGEVLAFSPRAGARRPCHRRGAHHREALNTLALDIVNVHDRSLPAPRASPCATHGR